MLGLNLINISKRGSKTPFQKGSYYQGLMNPTGVQIFRSSFHIRLEIDMMLHTSDVERPTFVKWSSMA